MVLATSGGGGAVSSNGQDILGGSFYLFLPIPEPSEEGGSLFWVPIASRASEKSSRVTEREGSEFEEQCLSFPPNTDLGRAGASVLPHSFSGSLRKLGVEGWEIKAQASSRVSSAWTGTSAYRTQGQPSLSHCPRRKGRGQGSRLPTSFPRLFGRRNPAGCPSRAVQWTEGWVGGHGRVKHVIM